MLLKEIVSGDKTYQLLGTNKYIKEEGGKGNIYFQIDYVYISTEVLNGKKELMKRIKGCDEAFKNKRLLNSHVVVKSFRLKRTSSKKFQSLKDDLIKEHESDFENFVLDETEKDVMKLWEDIEKLKPNK